MADHAFGEEGNPRAVAFGEDDTYAGFLHQLFREAGEGNPRQMAVAFGEDETYAGFLLQLFREAGEENPRRCNKYACSCAIAASIACLVLGFELGVMSEATQYLRPDQQPSILFDDLSLGVSKLFSLFGSALAGSTSNRLSSRFKLVLATAILFLGLLFMVFGLAPFYLLLGRLIINMGMGYTLTVVSVYIVDISPTSYRGLLTSFPEVLMNVGTLLAYSSHFFLFRLRTKFARSYLLGLGGIPFALVFYGVLVMPESPRWLVKHGRVEKAREILLRITDSEEETASRLDEVISETSGEGAWQAFLHPTQSILHMSICVFLIYFFQQASGGDTMFVYGPRIFEQTSIVNQTEQLLLLIAVEFVKTIFTLICAISIDRVGRRRLMLISVGGMILSLGSLGVSLTIIHHHKEVKWADAICIISLLCYTASFAIGIGPVALIYSSEIYPMRLRAQGCAISIALGQVVSGVMTMTFIILYRKLSFGGAAFLFMGIAMVAWVFLYLLMPETKRKSSEEIRQAFGSWTAW